MLNIQTRIYLHGTQLAAGDVLMCKERGREHLPMTILSIEPPQQDGARLRWTRQAVVSIGDGAAETVSILYEVYPVEVVGGPKLMDRANLSPYRGDQLFWGDVSPFWMKRD